MPLDTNFNARVYLSMETIIAFVRFSEVALTQEKLVITDLE